MQVLAKTPNSPFEVRGQLSDTNNCGDVDSPIYGFKRNIIGLIASIIYGNKSGQDILRESEGLAALLDCAKIDDRNPFILQWSIFAIRNALHGNEKNQHFISQLQKQGIVDDNLVNKVQFKSTQQ